MTTIPISTVPKAITAIYTATRAQLTAAGEGGVLVVVGTPGANDPADMIQVATNVSRTITVASFVGSGGRGWLTEKYDVTVIVSSAMATQTAVTDSLTVSNRAWKLLAYVETAVRSDPSLGNLVQIAFPLRTTGGDPKTGTGTTPGRVVTLTTPIHVEARI